MLGPASNNGGGNHNANAPKLIQDKSTTDCSPMHLVVESTFNALHATEYWEEIKRDSYQGPLLQQIVDDFEFNIVVLGAPRVGKTSLVSSITSGNLVHSEESHNLYAYNRMSVN